MSARPEAERDAAWTFIKWLMEPEQQAEWFAGSGYLPVRNSAYDLPAAKDIIAKYPAVPGPGRPVREDGDNNRRPGTAPRPLPAGADAVRTAIESMVSGDASPDEAMAAAVKDEQRRHQRLQPPHGPLRGR